MDLPSPNYLANILFVGNFDIISTQAWTYPFAHYWSICIEEHFYLVWPFIILFVPKKHLVSVFSSLIFFSILFRIYTSYTDPYSWHTLFLHTFSRIDVLVVGAIGAYYYSERPFQLNLSRTTRVLLFTTLLIMLSVDSVVGWNTVFLAGFKKFSSLAIIALLLLDYNFNPNYKHLLKNKSIIHYLGKVSFGIYMYGNVILLIMVKGLRYFQIYNIWIFFLTVFVFSLIIPVISYELFEKQILKLNKRFRVIKTDR